MLIRFWMARPLEVREPSGTSKMRIQKQRPFCVKMSNQLWLVAEKISSMKS